DQIEGHEESVRRELLQFPGRAYPGRVLERVIEPALGDRSMRPDLPGIAFYRHDPARRGPAKDLVGVALDLVAPALIRRESRLHEPYGPDVQGKSDRFDQ